MIQINQKAAKLIVEIKLLKDLKETKAIKIPDIDGEISRATAELEEQGFTLEQESK